MNRVKIIFTKNGSEYRAWLDTDTGRWESESPFAKNLLNSVFGTEKYSKGMKQAEAAAERLGGELETVDEQPARLTKPPSTEEIPVKGLKPAVKAGEPTSSVTREQAR